MNFITWIIELFTDKEKVERQRRTAEWAGLKRRASMIGGTLWDKAPDVLPVFNPNKDEIHTKLPEQPADSIYATA